MILESLSGITTYTNIPVIASFPGSTVLELFPIMNVRALRINVKNTGAIALDSAILGISWELGAGVLAYDSAAVTSAFGTLASGATGTLLETNLYVPYLSLTLSANTSPTTVNIIITPIYI